MAEAKGFHTQEDEALAKALQMAERADDFSAEERKALKKVAQVWRGLEAVWWLSSLLKSGLVWTGIVVGSVIAFRMWLADWLLGAPGK